MWKKFTFPYIPSMEENSPYAKRLEKRILNELILHESGYIEGFMRSHGIDSPRKAVEFVIREIEYPFSRLGRPTDTHIFNFFDGKACFKLSLDYWQTAYETVLVYRLNKLKGKKGYGDCEDVSILCAAFLDILKYPYYVMFGEVFTEEQYLGGHAWLIAELDGKWRLYEMTLDEPLSFPDDYPEVDPSKNRFKVDELIYDASVKWNALEFYIWMGGVALLRRYFGFTKKEKNSKKKVKKIREVYKRLRR